MSLDEVDPKPISEDDTSTAYTAITPPSSTTADLQEDHDPLYISKPISSVPWPNSTFKISSVASGHVLTIVNGEVVLASPDSRPDSRDYIYWDCIENNGWLGFRNTKSKKFLGHNIHGNLVCDVQQHKGWERFCVRMMPDGGYVLLMTHWESLWPVDTRADRGIIRLMKTNAPVYCGAIWNFIKIQGRMAEALCYQ